jgi:tape measure domain-containing protein
MLNLGDINFGLGVDTRALDRAVRRMQQFGEVVNRAAESQDEGARRTEAALRRQEAAVTRGLNSVLRLNEQIRRSAAGDDQARLLDQTRRAFETLEGQLARNQRSTLAYQRANTSFSTSLEHVRRQLAAVRHEHSNMEGAARTQQRVEQAMMRQQNAAMRAANAVQNLNAQIRRTAQGDAGRLLHQTRMALETYKRTLDSGVISTQALQRANINLTSSLDRVKRALAQIRHEQAQGNKGNTAFGNFLREIGSASVIALGPLSGIGARIAAVSIIANRSGLAFAAFAAGIAGVSLAMGKLSGSAIRTALDIQRIESRLKSVTGAVEIAQGEFDGLKNLASATGVEFVTLATQYTRFIAASQGTALEGQRAREVFENLAFAVGNFQLEAVQAEGVFRAVEQIMSKGTVAAEEIRQQLGDRLPGAFKAAADAMGVTTAEFNKLLKQGKIASDQFLLPFSRQVRQRLAGDAGDAVDSLRASINRLYNSFTFFNDSMDKTFGLSRLFKGSVEALTSVVNFFARNLSTVATILGAIAGGFALIALPRIIGLFASLRTAVAGAAVAFLGLNTAIVANPFTGLITVAARFIAIIGGAALAYTAFGNSVADAAEKTNTAVQKADDLIESQEALKQTVGETANAYIEAAKLKIEALQTELDAIKEVDAAQKQFIKNFDASGRRWFDVGIDEWAARLVAGLKQNAGEAQREMEPIISSLEKARERLAKLQELANQPSSTKFNFDDDSTKRATKAIREAQQAIDGLVDSNKAMLEGPRFFEQFEEQAEINKKIQDFRDRLVDAGVSVDTIRSKVDQYSFALKYNKEILDGTFKDMVATYESFRDIVVNNFQAMGDKFAETVMKGQFNAQGLVDTFRSMVQQIIAQVLKLAVINPILNSLFSLGGGQSLPTFSLAGIGNLFGFAKGGAFDRGNILRSTTPFMTNQGPAVAGESGPEAIMPLVMGPRGLGIRTYGAENDRATADSPMSQRLMQSIVVNMTVNATDAGSFKRSESQIAARLQMALRRGNRNM